MTSVDSGETVPGWVLQGEALEGEEAPGLAEWAALEQWRASWRPERDPLDATEELGTLFRRVMRQGYAAYVSGTRAMPALFALDSDLASMWQQGFACARTDAALGLSYRPACGLA